MILFSAMNLDRDAQVLESAASALDGGKRVMLFSKKIHSTVLAKLREKFPLALFVVRGRTIEVVRRKPSATVVQP